MIHTTLCQGLKRKFIKQTLIYTVVSKSLKQTSSFRFSTFHYHQEYGLESSCDHKKQTSQYCPCLL